MVYITYMKSLLSKDELLSKRGNSFAGIGSSACLGEDGYSLSEYSFVVLLLIGLSWNVVTSSLFFLDKLLGLSEGLGKSVLEGVVSNGSLGLGLFALLGLLGLESSGFLGLSLLIHLGEELCLLLGEWVELEHHGLVGKWVLLGLVMGSDRLSDLSELGLNLVRVDDSGKIGAGHNVSLEMVSRLLEGLVSVGSENGGEGLEGIGGENDESSKVSTWGELEDVKSVDVASVNTWEVSGGILDSLRLLGVDNEWSLSHDVSGVSVFTSS